MAWKIGGMAVLAAMLFGCSVHTQSPIKQVAYDFSDYAYYDRDYAPSPNYAGPAASYGQAGIVPVAASYIPYETNGCLNARDGSSSCRTAPSSQERSREPEVASRGDSEPRERAGASTPVREEAQRRTRPQTRTDAETGRDASADHDADADRGAEASRANTDGRGEQGNRDASTSSAQTPRRPASTTEPSTDGGRIGTETEPSSNPAPASTSRPATTGGNRQVLERPATAPTERPSLPESSGDRHLARR